MNNSVAHRCAYKAIKVTDDWQNAWARKKLELERGTEDIVVHTRWVL